MKQQQHPSIKALNKERSRIQKLESDLTNMRESNINYHRQNTSANPSAAGLLYPPGGYEKEKAIYSRLKASVEKYNSSLKAIPDNLLFHELVRLCRIADKNNFFELPVMQTYPGIRQKYFELIVVQKNSTPMDFITLSAFLDSTIKTPAQLRQQMSFIWQNAKLFNGADSVVGKAAAEVEKAFNHHFAIFFGPQKFCTPMREPLPPLPRSSAPPPAENLRRSTPRTSRSTRGNSGNFSSRNGSRSSSAMPSQPAFSPPDLSSIPIPVPLPSDALIRQWYVLLSQSVLGYKHAATQMNIDQATQLDHLKQILGITDPSGTTLPSARKTRERDETILIRQSPAQPIPSQPVATESEKNDLSSSVIATSSPSLSSSTPTSSTSTPQPMDQDPDSTNIASDAKDTTAETVSSETGTGTGTGTEAEQTVQPPIIATEQLLQSLHEKITRLSREQQEQIIRAIDPTFEGAENYSLDISKLKPTKIHQMLQLCDQFLG